MLSQFRVSASNKEYEFWQRDSLAFELNQKIQRYKNLNTFITIQLAEHWQLTDSPVKYLYSSAKYYETEIDGFGFLNHLMDVF
ncbi:MAG TPA: hypothetical protein VK787_05395 [Puia sp.]|nr:hypothetical protein [Puia sp.]